MISIGCFDLLHFGHINGLRQVKQCDPDYARGITGYNPLRHPDSTIVVAGIHSNDEIRRVKGGAFLNTESEKERLLRACRFVDEIVHDVKYDEIVPEDYQCDFVMHGDDEVKLPSGLDMYGRCKATEKFLYFRRTEGTIHFIRYNLEKIESITRW